MSKRKPVDVCLDCDETEEDHHKFNPIMIPESCICDHRDWGDPSTVPDVCGGTFVAGGYEVNTCSKCHHEPGCHK